MRVSVALLCIFAVLAVSSVRAQTNCNEIEFDAFSIGGNGQAQYNLYELLSLGPIVNGLPEGLTLSNGDYTVILNQPILNGKIDILIILSPDQGSTLGLLSNLSQGIIQYAINPDNITLSLNGGTPQTQIFNPNGNNFTFDNFLGDGSAPTYNILNVQIYQNSSAPGGTATCTSIYEFNITNPANVTVKGDPQFMGLRGQSYQIHGIDGAVYNLISDKAFQLNSRFIFLSGTRPCPVMPSTGRKSSACWTHPGSYLSELGLRTSTTQVFVAAGSAANGFSAITVNGKPLRVGEVTQYISYNSTHELTIFINGWTIEVENSDMFVNLRSVRVEPSSWSSISSHGLLGQTWSNKRYSGKVAAIEGEVDDYVVEENNVFGSHFVFNKYE